MFVNIGNKRPVEQLDQLQIALYEIVGEGGEAVNASGRVPTGPE